MTNLKRCSRCKTNLPLNEFGSRTAAADGLHPYCKQCVRDYCVARYAKHADEIKAAAQAYRESNAEAVKASAKLRYQAEKGKYAERMAGHYRKNREYLLERRRSYRATRDAEVERAYKNEYRKANRALTREWEHRRRARERASMVVPLTPAIIAAKVDYWGRKCWVCSGAFEAIDHVKPLSKGGPHILANLRPICGSCNSKKHSIWPYPPLSSTEG